MEHKYSNEIGLFREVSTGGLAELPPVPRPAKAQDQADASPAPADEPPGVTHLDLVRVVERFHRRYLDLFRLDLGRLGVDDLSPSQVMMLFTIGSDELTVRDLIDRGYYLGSNASYNLKRLVEGAYVDRSASERDRRSARIRLSEKGRKLCEDVRRMDESYHRLVTRTAEEKRDLETAFRTLQRLENVWTGALRYGETGLA
jgi:Transcriptional regulators